MKCTKFRKLLIPYTEGSLPEIVSESVERHLAECESCARELRSLTCTVDVLKQVEYPTFEPAVDLRSRVLAQITPEPACRPWWQPARMQTYSAAMAGLILVAIAGAGMWKTLQHGVEVPARTQRVEHRQVEKAQPTQGTRHTIEVAPDAAAPSSKIARKPSSAVHKGGPVVAADDSNWYMRNRGREGIPDLRITLDDNAGRALYDDYGNYGRYHSYSFDRGVAGTDKKEVLRATKPTASADAAKSLGYGVCAGELTTMDSDTVGAPTRPRSQELTHSMNQSALGGAQNTLSDDQRIAASLQPSAPAAGAGNTWDIAAAPFDVKRGAGNFVEPSLGNLYTVEPGKARISIGNGLYADTTLGVDIGSLETKLRDFPSSVVVITDLMTKYRLAGRPRDEYNMAERLTKLDPNNAGYWLSRAQAADRVPMPKTAQSCYQHAIKLGLKGAELQQAQARVKALEAPRK